LVKHFKAHLELGILQANVVSHTDADAETRILGQPVYMGKLERGSRVLIVDDVITFGSTLANLRGWIEGQGAEVGGATTLAAGFGATKLALPESVRERLLEKFPVQAETLANALGFMANCFTNREARFLCGLKHAQDIENLITTAHEMNLARERSNVLEHGIPLDPTPGE
jgi:hypothetical protein